jgi:microcystin-dependent protein
MSEPFLAEIKMVGFNFAPRGWAFCDGQILPINQNQALYSLLGTTYGGDGRTTFALPDLRGRTPVHIGEGFTLGAKGGEEVHQITLPEMPAHAHGMMASSLPANQEQPDVWARQNADAYQQSPPNAQMNAASLSSVGGGQGHTNMQPYLVLYFAIALQGLFPSRS